jgi:hypothetical protein
MEISEQEFEARVSLYILKNSQRLMSLNYPNHTYIGNEFVTLDLQTSMSLYVRTQVKLEILNEQIEKIKKEGLKVIPAIQPVPQIHKYIYKMKMHL